MKKAEKRKQKQKDRGIVDFIRITKHFLGELPQWINEMEDPRHQSYVTYTQSDLVMMGVLKNVCSVESMRQMDEKFNEETCIETLRILSGDKKLEEMPHYDTLNYYLEQLSPECLSELRRKMINSLIRGKQFYKNRLLGKYWRVIIDGTGLFYFKERHCENCLSTTRIDENGNKVKYYYHKVVEAKLVLGEKIIISLGTEFIENENENVRKQDCEINAAKRMLKRLKKEYPRLPICIQGDALYEAESLMKLCREYGWKYIFTHKETRQRAISEDYKILGEEEGRKKYSGICEEKGTGRYYNHIEKISDKKEEMNLYEYSYDKKTKKGKKEVHFSWVSNIELTERNIEEMIKAGRGRWKIENEGFNSQKQGIYKIEHLNSRNNNAMKNHYLLTQLSDMVMQLYLAWNPLIRKMGQSIKNTSSRLLETFRTQPISNEDVQYIERYTLVYLE